MSKLHFTLALSLFLVLILMKRFSNLLIKLLATSFDKNLQIVDFFQFQCLLTQPEEEEFKGKIQSN